MPLKTYDEHLHQADPTQDFLNAATRHIGAAIPSLRPDAPEGQSRLTEARRLIALVKIAVGHDRDARELVAHNLVVEQAKVHRLTSMLATLEGSGRFNTDDDTDHLVVGMRKTREAVIALEKRQRLWRSTTR